MEWLTREEIEQVLDNLSADDLIRATDEAKAGAATAGLAFHYAAERLRGPLENGQRWASRVRASDFKYFAEQIREAIDIGSPLSGETSELLDSPTDGAEESDPLTFADSAPQTT